MIERCEDMMSKSPEFTIVGAGVANDLVELIKFDTRPVYSEHVNT